jgi:hypothetical protein
VGVLGVPVAVINCFGISISAAEAAASKLRPKTAEPIVQIGVLRVVRVRDATKAQLFRSHHDSLSNRSTTPSSMSSRYFTSTISPSVLYDHVC